MKVITLLFFVFAVVVCMAFAGCGLKVGPASDPWISVPDGLSFNVGVNNVDHVDDRKGLNINKGAR